MTSKLEQVLDLLGVKMPDQVYPDAIHLVGDNGGVQVQLICWRGETSDYLVADVDPETGELVNEKAMVGVVENPRVVYGNRAMARLFTRFNSPVPVLGYERSNPER